MHYLGVKFHGGTKEYLFSSDVEVGTNEYAVVNSRNGLALVKITNKSPKIDTSKEISSIVRFATSEDLKVIEQNEIEQEKAKQIFLKLVNEFNLEMSLTSVEISLDQKNIMFQYVSEKRVDFRDLLREMRKHFRYQIELRQVGARDKAKAVGGIGICGQILCCNKFLNDFNMVSIKMAKNQNMALNQEITTGCCGKLKCCIAYENDTYSHLKESAPKVGSEIKVKGHTFKVLNVMPIEGKLKVKGDGVIKIISLDEIDG